MRFHLPAFLIADLQGLFRFDLVYTFIHLDRYKEQQFSLLNAQQNKQSLNTCAGYAPTPIVIPLQTIPPPLKKLFYYFGKPKLTIFLVIITNKSNLYELQNAYYIISLCSLPIGLQRTKKDSLPYPKKNWEWLNLHGKVKTMEVHKKIMPDFIKEGSSQSFNNNIYSILFFNTDGYLYQKKGYYDSGKLFVTIDYVYDDQHNLISETEVTFSDEGTPLRKEAILYKYNNKGLLIQKDEYLGDQYAFKTLFVYDEKGICSQENKFIPPPIGKENDLTSQTTYSYNDKYYDLVKTTTYLERESEADVVSYKYDNKNT